MVLCDNDDCAFGWLHAKCRGIVSNKRLKRQTNIECMWFCPWCDERPLRLKLGLERPTEEVPAEDEGVWRLTAEGGTWERNRGERVVGGKKARKGKGCDEKAGNAGEYMGMIVDV
jgi:hypothetical protein